MSLVCRWALGLFVFLCVHRLTQKVLTDFDETWYDGIVTKVG